MADFSPEELSALERTVRAAAQLHEQKSRRSDGVYTRFFHLDHFCDLYPDLSVKYTDYPFMKTECLALQRLYDLANKDGDAAPLVPRVVHYFHGSGEDCWGYMIMERVHLREVSVDELCRKAAEAVLWLRAQRMDFFGSLGGANARHTVFQGGKAPKVFTSVLAAQEYLNVAVRRVQGRRPSWMPPLAEVTLEDEDIVLTQSDMDVSNFGVALDGRAVVFDAATIQALPKTLADYTLLRTTTFAKAVSAYVFDTHQSASLLASLNFASLDEVRRRLSTGDDDLGVDENGNIKHAR
ncbi:hypothetical protein GSI_11804 [Ganoderma sinense ZZ0214-1]|uniref:Aminoglycoside phosphotransferase domain-containing protein n=1 Tax=Ganoderma sinense ZZ0214-1 TaxID=1077348 RepID=A0A2G8RX15_9APHY|nr:hypothetical protein GSI_11804 [Ganoderma sinense ZZ0214-1]